MTVKDEARAILSDRVRKVGFKQMADDIAKARPCKVDSWIVLDLLTEAMTTKKE